jgi:MoaA/NifB/PqqE/SkfB family radical SAM enzyme
MAFSGTVLSLYLGIQCNSKCNFCVVHGRSEPEMSPGEVRTKLSQARESGSVDVVFSGGECTVRSDIIELTALAASFGYKSIQIQTNGRRFSNRQFASEIVAAGATEFAISLHGHHASLQDSMAGISGAFAETIKGINNLHDLHNGRATIIINSVITKENYKFLPELAEFLVDLRVSAMQFAFLHALGRVVKQVKALMPSKTEAQPYLLSALEVANRCGYDIGRVMVEAIPYCLLPQYEAFCSDLFIPPALVRTKEGDIIQFPLQDARRKGESCTTCNFYGHCYGPWREYPDYFGWHEFRPITDIRPEDVIPKHFLDRFQHRTMTG